MYNRNKFLKNILTTASTLAIAIGASEEAMAATVRNVSGGDARIATAQGMEGPFNSGDSLEYVNAGPISVSIDASVAVAGINFYLTSDLGPITVSSNGASLGSVASSQGGGNVAPLNINDGLSLSLTGTSTPTSRQGQSLGANDYSGLGAVTLGNTTGGAAGTALSITATGPVTFTNTFNSYTGTTANFPTLNISGANHIFNGAIGGTSKLGAINITDAHTVKFGANVTATSVNLNNASAQVTLGGGTMTSSIYANADLTSTSVNVDGANVTLVGSIGDATHRITALKFVTDNTITIDGADRHIYAYVVPQTNGAGTLKLANGQTTLHLNVGTYDGSMVPQKALSAINLNGQTLVIDSGIGNFYVAGQITTTDSGTGHLTTQGANTVRLFNDIGNGTAINTINANANTILYSGVVRASAINIASGKTLTIDSTSGTRNITGSIYGAGTPNVGNLLLQGTHNITINNAIGNVNPLSGVAVTNSADSVVTFSGDVTTNVNVDASVAGAAINFNGKINAASILTGAGAVTFHGDVNATSILTGSGGVTFHTNSVTSNIAMTNTASALTFTDTSLTGNITNSSGGVNSTVINISGANFSIAGSIGGSGNGGISAIKFISDHSLTIDVSAASRNIYAPIINNVTGSPTSGSGSIEVFGTSNRTMTFFNQIGTPDAPIKVIRLYENGPAVIFNNKVYATTTNVCTASATFANDVIGDLVLDNANAGITINTNADITGSITNLRNDCGTVT